MRHHRVRLAAVSGESSSIPPSESGGRHLPKIDVVLPDGPDDAGQFVGEGHGRFVVAAERLELQSPGAQTVGGATLLGSPEDGACAVDEQHAEVDVAALADGAEAADEAAGALARRQPQVAGQVTAGGEALHVSDEGDQGGSGDEADARDGAQAGNDRDLVGERLELGLDDTDAVLDVADLGAGFSEGGTQSVGQTGIGVGEQGRDPGKYMLSPEGDGATELAQQPADRIDTGGAGGEPGGTQAVQSGQSLLGDGLHGDGVNVLVAVRLEQPPSVGAVRLVTEDV